VEVIVPGEVDVFRPREPVLAACDIGDTREEGVLIILRKIDVS
jgi:hypothetical protein